MAYQVVSRPVGRRFAFAAPLALSGAFATVAARAQEADIHFQKSSLVIATHGRDIKFEVELALGQPIG